MARNVSVVPFRSLTAGALSSTWFDRGLFGGTAKAKAAANVPKDNCLLVAEQPVTTILTTATSPLMLW